MNVQLPLHNLPAATPEAPTEGHGASRLANLVDDERLRELVRYWHSLRGARLVPERADFDPMRVVRLLPYFWAIRRSTDTGDYRFTLAGDDISKLLGRRLIGETIDEVFTTQAGSFREALDRMLTEPAWVYTRGPLYRADRAPIMVERVAFPMASEGKLDTVYGATVYEWSSRLATGGAVYEAAAEPCFVSLKRGGPVV